MINTVAIILLSYFVFYSIISYIIHIAAKMLIAEMEERKPELFSQQIMRQSGNSTCLKAWQPVMMSQCTGSDGAVLPPAIDIVVEQNTFYMDEAKRKLRDATASNNNISFIDFSNPEDLFDFSARSKDIHSNFSFSEHSIVKVAKSMPMGFMKQILEQYQVPPKSSALSNGVGSDGNSTVTLSGALDEENYSSYTCHECKQQFSALHLFQQHFLTHPDPDNKKFLCQVCGKRFSRADHLNRHAQLHTNIKVHKCILCGEEFPRASHLDKHRRRTHMAAAAATTAPTTANLDPKLITNDNLHLLAAVASPESTHSFQFQPISESPNEPSTSMPTPELIVADHTNDVQISVTSAEGENEVECQTEPDRPFPCSVCGRKFIRATHLRRHMRIHTGEKPFFCHICGRRYARGDYLRAHIHAHRREKFHKCRVCGEVYHDLSRFSNHCLSHDESEFLEASLRETKKRAENKLTQKLSASKRSDIPQTAGPAAPAIAMPAHAEISSFMPEVSDTVGEICVSPIENPMHFVESHECTISSSLNHLQYQAPPENENEASVLTIPLNATDVNNQQQQQQLVIENTIGSNSNSALQLHISASSISHQSFPTQVHYSVSQPFQNHMITIPTPQDTPTRSPELSHLPMNYLQSSSAPPMSPPPLQMAVPAQPNMSDTDILQHYSFVKSFNNEVMLIAPPVNLSTNSNYNNNISATTVAGSDSYFPTPGASPMIYQGLSLSELRSGMLNDS